MNNKPVHLILVLQILTFNKWCNSSEIINKVINIIKFEDSPEVWHRYIKMFIIRYPNWNIFEHTHYSQYLFRILNYSRLFHTLKNVRFKFKYSSCGTVFIKLIKRKNRFICTCRKTQHIKHLTGSFNYSVPIIAEVYFYFILNPLLKLNLTFSEMFISHGNFKIHNVTDEIFIYEGYYSKFYLYLRFRKVFLKNKNIVFPYHGKSVCHLVSGSFTVMDENIIYTLPIRNHSNINPIFSYIVRNRYMFLSYFLQVNKHCQIFVNTFNMTKNEYFIVDGPGILSDVLKNEPVQACLTFQCSVFTFSTTGYWRFYSKFTACSQNLQIENNTTFSTCYPNEKCLNNICILCIDAEYGHQVNAKIISTHNFDSACSTRGIVAGEMLLDDYRQTETLCDNFHDGAKEPSPSFYSHNSSLTLVLYWYKPYSTIYVTINLSQTKCKPVRINVCEYDITCHGSSMPSKCDQYLKYVTKYTMINTFHAIRLHNYQDNLIMFTQEKGTCIIFHILSNNTNKFIHLTHCQVSIQFKHYQIIAIKETANLKYNSFIWYRGAKQQLVDFHKQIIYAPREYIYKENSEPLKKPIFYIKEVTVVFKEYCKCWIELISTNKSNHNKDTITLSTACPITKSNLCISSQ